MGDYNIEIKVSAKSFKTNGENIEIKTGLLLRKCENCSSKDIICVFSDGAGSIIGAYSEDEYFCAKCKHYTLYLLEYDS